MGLRTARNNIVVTACEGVITLFGAIVLSLVGFLGPFDASLTVAPRTGKCCAASKQTSKQRKELSECNVPPPFAENDKVHRIRHATYFMPCSFGYNPRMLTIRPAFSAPSASCPRRTSRLLEATGAGTKFWRFWLD